MSNGPGDWQGRFRDAVARTLQARRDVLAALEEYEGRGGAAWLAAAGVDAGEVAGIVAAQYTLGQIEAAFVSDGAFVPNLHRATAGEPPIGYVAPEEAEP